MIWLKIAIVIIAIAATTMLILKLAKMEQNEKPPEKKPIDVTQYFNWITPKLAIGACDASTPPQCWEHFDAILNLTMSEHENMHPPVGNYLWLPFVDGDAPKFTEYIPRAVEFIRFQTGKTLVHCAAGQSRSVSMVLAYMCEQDPPRSKEDIEQKISQLRAARPIIEPKQVFLHEIAIRHGITI